MMEEIAMEPEEKPVPFNIIIEELLNEENPFPARSLYRLSDLPVEELTLLEQTWPTISLRRRQAVMEDIQEFNQQDFLVNFFEVGLLAVHDDDPQVRLMAVLVLSEYDDNELVPLLIQLAEQDQSMPVRAAAASALGYMVEKGELEELPASMLHQVESCLLNIYNGKDDETVRLRALESLGYSSRPEVESILKSAYQSEDTDWLVSSLLAMGRSYDSAWAGDILTAMKDIRLEVQIEAAKAAGELELEDARPALLEMLATDDANLRQVVAWSLSQIGGNNVREALEDLLETIEDEDEADFIETALENLEFTEDFALELIDIMDELGELDEDELADLLEDDESDALEGEDQDSEEKSE
jgi:HEAT repeat protein